MRHLLPLLASSCLLVGLAACAGPRAMQARAPVTDLGWTSQQEAPGSVIAGMDRVAWRPEDHGVVTALDGDRSGYERLRWTLRRKERLPPTGTVSPDEVVQGAILVPDGPPTMQAGPLSCTITADRDPAADDGWRVAVRMVAGPGQARTTPMILCRDASRSMIPRAPLVTTIATAVAAQAGERPVGGVAYGGAFIPSPQTPWGATRDRVFPGVANDGVVAPAPRADLTPVATAACTGTADHEAGLGAAFSLAGPGGEVLWVVDGDLPGGTAGSRLRLLVAEAAARGIRLAVVAVGDPDADDDQGLRELARLGGGAYRLVPDVLAAQSLLRDGQDPLAPPVAEAVLLGITPKAGTCQWFQAVGHEDRRSTQGALAGETGGAPLTAGGRSALLIRLRFMPGTDPGRAPLRVTLRWRDPATGATSREEVAVNLASLQADPGHHLLWTAQALAQAVQRRGGRWKEHQWLSVMRQLGEVRSGDPVVEDLRATAAAAWRADLK